MGLINTLRWKNTFYPNGPTCNLPIRLAVTPRHCHGGGREIKWSATNLSAAATTLSLSIHFPSNFQPTSSYIAPQQFQIYTPSLYIRGLGWRIIRSMGDSAIGEKAERPVSEEVSRLVESAKDLQDAGASMISQKSSD